MIRRRPFTMAVLLLIAVVMLLTNPPEQDYVEFSPPLEGFGIEQVNFGLFSAYASEDPVGHNSIVHIGCFEDYFPVSDGQYGIP